MTPSSRLLAAALFLPLVMAVGPSEAQTPERRPRQQDDRVDKPAPAQRAQPDAAARGREEEAEREAGGKTGEEAERDNPTARLEAQRRETGIQSLELQQYILNERRQRAGAVTGGIDSTVMGPTAPQWLPIGPTGASYWQNGGFTVFERDSGRVRKILPHPTDLDTVYLLTSGGGLWHTNNFNSPSTTWTPLQDAMGTTSGGSVAFGRTPNVLYLGTGDPFDLVNTGGSMVKSTDGGTTWGPEVDLGDVFSIRDIAVDTSDPVNDIVMVATDFGFYRSVDGGATFALAASGPGEPFAGKSVWSFAQTSAGWLAAAQLCSTSVSVPGTRCGQFLAMSPPVAIPAAGTIYLSTDHGATWAPVPNTGGVYSNVGRTTLAVAVPGDNIVYAFAENEASTTQRDLFRSTDGGLNWTALGVNSTKNGTNGLTNPNVDNANMNLMHGQSWYNQLVLVDPADPTRNTVYLGGDVSTAKTTNGGPTWTLISNWVTRGPTASPNEMAYVHADGHAAAISGSRVMFGTDGGIFLSTDAGATWSSDKNNGLQTFLFYSIAGSPAFPNAVYGGAQDNGTRVREGHSTIYNQSIGGDGLGTGWGQANGYSLMGSVQGNSTRRNLNGVPDVGVTWEGTAPPIGGAGTGDGTVFSTPVEVPTAAADPTGKVFFTASLTSVYRTINAGNNWTIIGRVGSATNPIPAGVQLRGQVHGVGVSPVDMLHIGAVASAGRIILTTNGGTSWVVVNLNTIFTPQGGFVSTSAITYGDNNTIYVTSISPQLNLVRIAKTVDGGANWTRADGNGLPDVPVARLILDPRDATHNTLFAATWVGVFRTTDGGASWSQYGVGLPNVIVRDLYMPPNGSYIRAGTYGRGFYEIPSLNFVDATLVDDGVSCDSDSSLDNDETGHLSVTLKNASGADLSGITATITSTNPAVVFPDGSTLAFPPAPAGTDATAALRVQLSGASGIQQLDFAIAFDDPSLGLSMPPSVTRSFRGNIDLIPSGNADDSQSPVSAWTAAGAPPTSLPSIFNLERKAITPFEYQWFDIDSAGISEQTLTSPILNVGSGPFTWTFQHYSVFETNFDGMVLEISDNGGPWTDVGRTSITPTYNTPVIGLATGGGNPLEGRQAFTGRTLGYPDFLTVTVNLGTAYAGHSVRLRYRIGTDIFSGRPGVHIRNITISGILNTPFWAVVAEDGKCPTTTTVASDLNPSTYGDSVTLTAHVTGTGGLPTGNVTFKDGGASIGTATLDGTGDAIFTTSALTAGSHVITATYNGDATNSTSTSPYVLQVVNKQATTTALVSVPNPSVYPQTVTFTATVTPATSGSPTGTVTFTEGVTTLATVPLDGSGQASFSTSTLSAGSHSVIAHYLGNTNYLASDSATVGQVVNQATSTVTLTSSLNPSGSGQLVTFTATITAPPATGTIEFRDGATPIATVAISGNRAAMATSGLSSGVHSMSAIYSGDANISGRTSQTLIQTVNAAPLSCPASPVSAGSAFMTTVTGGSSNRDWVASYASGQPNSPPPPYQYVPLPRPQTLTVTAPGAVGTYQLRLYANDMYNLIGACTYQVAAGSAIEVGDATVTEGDSGTTSATFNVTLSPAASGTVTVNFATADGTATTAGSDYAANSGVVTFNTGESVKTITVLVNGDTIPEFNETLFVNLSAPSGASILDAQGQGTITNDDGPPPPVTCPTSSVLPGAAYNVTVNGGSSSLDWVASYPLGAPNMPVPAYQYVPLPRPQTRTLTASGTVGTYEVRLFANDGYGLIGSCTYQVAAGPALSINDVTVTEGNSGTTTTTFNVTLSPTSAGTVTVNFATANGTASAGSDYVANTGTVTFNPGDSLKTVVVTINGDATPENNETFFVNLSGPSGATISDAQGLGTITNDDGPIPAVTCPALVAPGASFMATVNGGSSSLDWVASYAVGAPGSPVPPYQYVPLPRPQTLTLSAPGTVGMYEVRLYANNGFSLIGTCPYQVSTGPTLFIDNVTVTEGDAGTKTVLFNVTLSPTSAGVVTVDWGTADGTATAGSDYQGVGWTLDFNPGESVHQVSVTINGDTTPENDETFFVNLTNPSGATIGDNQGLGTIRNDDGPPPPVTCPSSPVTASTPFTTTVNGGSSSLDWVASYAPGAPGSPVPPYQYVPLPRPATRTLTAPAAPGPYEVRLYANDRFGLIGSCSYTVVP
jgi:hypothetical protein